MKKIKKGYILSFILGAIIFGGIGVAAAGLFASDIQFKPKDSTWKKANGDNITTVAEAIDDLNTRKNSVNSVLNGRESSYQKDERVTNISISKGRFLLVVSEYSSSDYKGSISVSSNNSTVSTVDSISSDLNDYTNRVATISFGAASVLGIYLIESDGEDTVSIISYDNPSNKDYTSGAAGINYSLLKIN